MKKRSRSKQWILFIGVALLIHLALFIYIRPSFFLAFKHSPLEDATTAPYGRGMPDAIVYIPIEIDDGADRTPVEKLDRTQPEQRSVEPTDRLRAPKTGAPSQPDVSLENMLGDASQPLPQGPGATLVQIPPRPLEITWPDTRKLKHCLGHHIDVRIQVAEDGAILQVVADEEAHPPDCVSAAMESARRIVFAPGKINGKPAKMWTRIRIDFKERN